MNWFVELYTVNRTFPVGTFSTAKLPTCMPMEVDAEDRLCYRQRKEHSSGGEITLMKWSPTMDVIALAFADNSVRSFKDKYVLRCSATSITPPCVELFNVVIGGVESVVMAACVDCRSW